MKKLAVTSIAVLIALCGFIAILYFLPGGCCGDKQGCEMRESKCSGEKEGCEHKGKCGEEKEKCMGHGDHSQKMESGHGCEMKDGPNGCKSGNDRKVKIMINGDGKGDVHMSCPMETGDHSGCCGCCMMNQQGWGKCWETNSDSSKTDSVRMKVRGKL
jgi:hypothetical protein